MASKISIGVLSGYGLGEKEKSLARKKVEGWAQAKKLRAFTQAGPQTEKVLRGFPQKMWAFTLSPKNWCVTQVLWHLADQEANLYVRLRRGAAEPGGAISPYDQNRWDSRLLYKKADPQQAKDILLLLRRANSDLLRRLPVSVWKNKVRHPEWGALSVDRLVGINIWHLDHHLAQMGKRYAEWKARG